MVVLASILKCKPICTRSFANKPANALHAHRLRL